MSFIFSDVEGVLPHWQCDSCTTQEHKTCALVQKLRGTLATLPIRPYKGLPQYPAQVEALEPIFSQVEKLCPQSQINIDYRNSEEARQRRQEDAERLENLLRESEEARTAIREGRVPELQEQREKDNFQRVQQGLDRSLEASNVALAAAQEARE